MAALVKEAICKGDGDMLTEYTYVMNTQARGKDRKGQIKEETTNYEVFIPILKSGMRTTGILLVTGRNGIPILPNDLERERLRTAKRLEIEEEKLLRNAPLRKAGAEITRGLLPLGMYTSTSIGGTAFGSQRGGAILAVDDFLKACDLTLMRREQKEGREVLVFNFAPRPHATFNDKEKYIAQLTGEILIDATDRIVTRLAGWPRVLSDRGAKNASLAAVERPPAVYFEMMRLREGIWLPHVVRINGLDYPKLFDRIFYDSIGTYSNYIHFFTEIRDTTVESPPSKP